MYMLKNQLDLSVDGKITDKVTVEYGKLIIYENGDVIIFKNSEWFINGTYQGKDAVYSYIIENPIIINEELFNKLFEKIITSDLQNSI